MKKVKLCACLVSIFSLLGMLGACAPTTSSSTPDSSSSSSSSQQPGGKVEVLFWHTFSQSIVNSLEQVIPDFEAAILETEGVEVDIQLAYQGGYDEIVDKITKGFSTGNIPTMAIAYPDHVADYLLAEQTPGQYVVNLDQYISNSEYGFGTEAHLGDKANYDEYDIVEAFLDEGRQYIREGTYSLPFMKSSEVMFYNVEALTAVLNLYKPEFGGAASVIKEYIDNISWEDFMDLLGFIQDNKDQLDMPSLEIPAFYDSDSNFFISKMFQNEIAYSSIVDGNGQIDFESGEARSKAEAMVAEMKEDYDSGKFFTKGTEGTYGSDHFKNAKSIFSIGSSGGAGYNIPSADDFTVGVCKVPASNDNPLYVSQGPTFTMLRNPALSNDVNDARNLYAWKFMKFLTNPDMNVRICITGSEGYVPIRYSAYESANFLDYLEIGEELAEVAKIVINDIDGNYLNTAVFKGSATLRDQVGGILVTVFKGDKSVSQAFTDAINNTKLKM